jgi:hypothetical protein
MALPRSFGRISALGLLLAGAAALTAAAPAAGPAAMAPSDTALPQAADRVVQITVQGNSVSVDQASVSLSRSAGQAVVWRFASGSDNAAYRFAIVVHDHNRAFPGLGAAEMHGRSVRAAARPNSTPGTYKYSVVVWNGTQLLIDDPEIVIEPN